MSTGDSALAQLSIAGQMSSGFLFVDECIIRRPSPSKGTFNKATGQYDDVPEPTVIYEGPCRMQVRADINSNVVETGAPGTHESVYLTSQVQLPLSNDIPGVAVKQGSSAAVRADDVCEWTAAGRSSDENMVGRIYNIAGPFHKTHASKRRFRVREVVA